jgi:transcriptional regulator with XRE-family HTH domain
MLPGKSVKSYRFNDMTTRLEQERRLAGLSQEQLADRAGIAQATISKLERLKLLTPSFNLLARLAVALRRCGCDVDAADLNPSAVRLVVSAPPLRPRRRPTPRVPRAAPAVEADPNPVREG